MAAKKVGVRKGSKRAKVKVDRPAIPYGLRAADEGIILPWRRVQERMTASYIYWITTAGGRGPHAVPVWGVWLDDALYFSNGPTTRTGRNLAADARVSVHLESGEDVVIVEGAVTDVRSRALTKRINDVYCAKYLWEERIEDGWYEVRPRVAFAWLCPSVGLGNDSVYQRTPTRWRFS